MANRAVVLRFNEIVPNGATDLTISGTIYFISNAGDVSIDGLDVQILGTDTPAQFKTKIVDRAVALAAAKGLAVARAAVIFPSFERGT